MYLNWLELKFNWNSKNLKTAQAVRLKSNLLDCVLVNLSTLVDTWIDKAFVLFLQ